MNNIVISTDVNNKELSFFIGSLKVLSQQFNIKRKEIEELNIGDLYEEENTVFSGSGLFNDESIFENCMENPGITFINLVKDSFVDNDIDVSNYFEITFDKLAESEEKLKEITRRDFDSEMLAKILDMYYRSL